MDRRHTSRMALVTVASASAFLGGVAHQAIAVSLPRDPCALLKPVEVQALAPNAKIGNGVSDTSGAPLAVGCTFSWGPATPAWGPTSLSVIVTDVSQIWPSGLSADDIKERVNVEAQSGGPSASEVPGIGDGAVFTFETSKRTALHGEVLMTGEAKAKAYVAKGKGLMVLVTLHDGSDALAQKDKVIALLRSAVGRL